MSVIKHVKKQEKEFDEQVVEIKRVSRTVKGGKRMRFRVLMVVGDRKGRVGLGVAKGNDVQESIQKATVAAKKHMFKVPIQGNTIPHEIQVKYGASEIFAKPASPGTSLIAGGAVRTVFELAGIKDIVAKNLGSTNKVNSTYAAIELLKALKLKQEDKINPNIDKAKEKTQKQKGEKTKKPIS